jgi:hypothetical protein
MIRYKKNPKGSSKIIEVDGKQYQAKYIGKGHFSKVYRVGDRVVYYTRGDCGKEVLAMFQYDRIAHLPEIIRHENITVRPGVYWYVFSSPYYRNVTQKDASAYKLMKKIILWYSEYRANYAHVEGYDGMMRFAKFVEYDVPHSIVRALKEIALAAGNCGGYVGFDLTKSNFGVNEYGTLIFRDPIYVRD